MMQTLQNILKFAKRHCIALVVVMSISVLPNIGYAENVTNSPSLIEHSINLLQGLFAKSEEEVLKEKEKADPNDP